jgi:uncharacterized protein YciI
MSGPENRVYRCFMYIALLNHTAPIEEIDYLLADHVEWLVKHFREGHFLAAGKAASRADGVILARPMPRLKLDAVLASDPFVVKHMSKYEVIEFSASRTAPELRLINEALVH